MQQPPPAALRRRQSLIVPNIDDMRWPERVMPMPILRFHMLHVHMTLQDLRQQEEAEWSIGVHINHVV